jgi:hypothetical protein
MSRPVAWLLVALLLGGFVAAAGYVLRVRAAAGKGFPDYSIYSRDGRRGAAEAAYVLGRAGWTPVALTRPVPDSRVRGLLIVAEPQGGDPIAENNGVSDAEAAALLQWVERGNTLLLFGRKSSPLHELLEAVPMESADADATPQPVRLDDDLDRSAGYLRDVRTLSVNDKASLRPRADAQPLWWVGRNPGAYALWKGAGRVVVVADPGLLTYTGLWEKEKGEDVLRDDDVMFLINAAQLHARDGIVYFDEYHHGFRSGGGFWGYLHHYGQHLFLLPLLLVLAAAAWRWGVRLGPAVPTPKTSEADAVEYASALARLYQQAGVRRLMGRTAVRGFLGALATHLRLRRNALPAEVLAGWREHDAGASAQRLQALLRGVADLRKGASSERQLLMWTQDADLFVEEMQTAERGPKKS